MPSSRWSALPAKMISTRRICWPPLQRPAEPKHDSRRGGNGGNHSVRPKPIAERTELSLALSASLRDELLREIESINSDNEAALWGAAPKTL